LLPFDFSSERLEEYVLYKILKRGNPAWDEVAYEGNTPGPIMPDRPVTVDFTCSRPGLTRLRMLLATYRRVQHAALEVRLHEVTPTGQERLVRQGTIAAGTLADNSFHAVDFEPIADSDGKHYRVTLASPTATAQTAITIWVNKNLDDTYLVGTEQRTGRVVMEAWCLSGGREQRN
jgi:hypothetical protein